MFFDWLETIIRYIIVFITNFLPVKVIRDDKGRPFLFRYHVFALTKNGPGICFHHFVKSDPDRGYHDHPWSKATSFILCGGYDERIYNENNPDGYDTFRRGRWTFNHLKGSGVYHRVMLGEGCDAWTLFFFRKRSKTWGMIDLKGELHQMSTTIEDADGGWWNHVMKGLGLHQRLNNKGNVVATVDCVITADNHVLLIKRSKAPFKDMWALPGGRIEQSDKSIIDAAYRELREETNLNDVELKYVDTVGDSSRDPRGFGVSIVYHGKLDEIPENVKAGDDAFDFKWFDLTDLPELAFDHRQIIEKTLESK